MGRRTVGCCAVQVRSLCWMKSDQDVVSGRVREIGTEEHAGIQDENPARPAGHHQGLL